MNNEDPRPIGVFDSGIGGLTVLRAMLELLPHESYIYVGDTEYLPYGNKSPELIKKLALEVTATLLKQNVKALIVACNTISAVALPEIRSLAQHIPVIDVIEPTVLYTLKYAQSKKIAVIATETTISSHIYENKIQELSSGAFQVISKATPSFVPLIEENPHNNPLIEDAIDLYLREFKDNTVLNTLILGCTHYPMIKEYIERYLGTRFVVIDSAHPTANALKELLTREQMLHSEGKATRVFFTSDDPSRSLKIAEEFLGGDVELHQMTIEGRR